MKDSEKFHLIECVRNYPALYRLSRADYKDASVRKNCWEKISAEVGFPDSVCKSTWDNLRSNYKRAKRTSKKIPSGSEASNKKAWAFLEAMSFIDDCQPTETTSNFEDDLTFTEEIFLEPSLTPLPSEGQEFSCVSRASTPAALTVDSDSSDSQPGPRKRVKASPTGPIDRLLSSSEFNSKKLTETACALLASVASALVAPKTLSESEVFGQHIARQLEPLDVPTRALAMLKMSEIAFLARFGELSVKGNINF